MSRPDSTTLADAVADYLDSGDSARITAKRHGITDAALLTTLKDLGLTRNSGGHVHPRIRNAAVADFRNGMSINKIAQKYRVSRASVRTWIDDLVSDDPDELPGDWVRVGLTWRHPSARQSEAA